MGGAPLHQGVRIGMLNLKNYANRRIQKDCYNSPVRRALAWSSRVSDSAGSRYNVWRLSRLMHYVLLILYYYHTRPSCWTRRYF